MLSMELAQDPVFEEVLVHTGQHFDPEMSQIFFEEMGLPQPKYNLGIHSLPHGAMTGRMLEALESLIMKEKPHLVVVYGDTNSTLAGALAAKKQKVPVAHIEAGLRSYDMNMPEEINRVLTDRISDLLFCPTETAVNNLKKEGFNDLPCKIYLVGDIMYDASLYFRKFSKKPLFEVPENFVLVTIHREENVENFDRLFSIISFLNKLSRMYSIIFPVHPRTRKAIKKFGLVPSFDLMPPVSYFEMLYLLERCKFVVTDSGGLQKEAYFFCKRCLIMRENTEWKELVLNGFHLLFMPFSDEQFNKFLSSDFEIKKQINFYGNGKAAKSILRKISEFVA